MTIRKLARIGLLLGLAAGPHAMAQGWDTTGNGLLKGTYYFREVVWLTDSVGDLTRALAVYGNINFDGAGNYNLSNTQLLDTGAGSPGSYSKTGTYSISASGYGFLTSPVSMGASIYGLVSQGIFIASSTENGFNDLMIAAPLSSPAPTLGTLSGTYVAADIDSPDGNPADTIGTLFQMNPDGRGNLGTVNASGYIASQGTNVYPNTINNVKYISSNGAYNLQFPNSNSNLLVGNYYLYISPDGNFVFGGAPNGWDMMVGVRVQSGTKPTFDGLYYQAGLTQSEQFSAGYADLQTYYGSFKAISGLLLGHQRILSVVTNALYDYTYTDSYTSNADGTFDEANNLQHYVFGAGGAIGIGFGKFPFLGVSVMVKAPSFSGSGPFIDPTGVLNNSSSSMFTSGIARGELLSIYGTNLASKQLTDGTFPTTLGGVQVMINNRPAPIYTVSPGLIQAIVPYATEVPSIASIQVISNGVTSNAVTVFTNTTSPGLSTVPAGGVGYAAAQHVADYSLITPSNPAKVGESIILYGTGFGDVTPAVPDGGPGSSTPPYSTTSNTISVFIDGIQAQVGFAGLTPQLIGLYQLNVTVPTGVSTGDVSVDVAGSDSYSAEALLSVSGTATANPLTRRKTTRPRIHANSRK